MRITLTGLSHKSAPVEVRERLAAGPEAVCERLLAIREAAGVRECALLATCNRMEVYALAADPPGSEGDGWQERLFQFLAAHAGVSEPRLQPHLYCYEGAPAVRHLFRVASGLDSMVVGESQILSQVKDALGHAQEAGTAESILQSLFRHAIEAGKRARTETEIARGAVSISWAAIQLAQQIFGRRQARTALIIGAGETGEQTARVLQAQGVSSRLLVCNRTWERAADLAAQLGGDAVPFERLGDALIRADIVVSSTGATQPVLTRAMLRQAMRARRGRPLFLIDIAVPRDVEPAVADLEDVFLYNIDDLQAVVDKSLAVRQSEVERVEAIVEAEVQRFGAWLRTREVGPTITALQRRAEAIREAEMERLKGRLRHLSPDDLSAVETTIRGVLNKLLHRPMVHIRSAAASGDGYHDLELIRTLFDLDEELAERNGRRSQGSPAEAGITKEPALTEPGAPASIPRSREPELAVGCPAPVPGGEARP
jgi:glutamyl-tRNA reductase